MFLFRKKKAASKPSKSSKSSVTKSLPQTPILSGPMDGQQEITPGGSQKYSFPRPPRLSPSSNLLASPTSPTNLTFDGSKQAPSYVRHVRAVSGASGSFAVDPALTRSLQVRQQTINLDLPPELLPVVNLMNAQKLRQYVSGTVSVLSEDHLTWSTALATLTGVELAVHTFDSIKPRYINIQDSSVVPSPVNGTSGSRYELVILQDFDGHQTTLRFANSEQLYLWLSAIHLSKFENSSLQEAFTAVILSLKGPELSDIFTLLSHKQRFTRYEWSNLRLPQISNKWVKVFVNIVPGDNKKNGRIEVYASDKITKKNLVLYVDHLDSIYNVYPEDYKMIDVNLIMKLEGQVYVNKKYQHLFIHGTDGLDSAVVKGLDLSPVRRSDSAMSLSSLGPPGAIHSPTRSRSNSLSSSSSFFVNAASTSANAEGDSLATTSPKASTKFIKQSASSFVKTDYLYLMPEPHPGVGVTEIMLRNFIHIIDAFKLYGRPEHLVSNKRDPVSMLFGLPALPHHCYLELEDAYEVIALNFELSCLQNWGLCEWRASIKEYISCKQRDSNFKGTGNIYDLFNSLEDSQPSSPILRDTQSPVYLQAPPGAKAKSPFADSTLKTLKSLDSVPSTEASTSHAIPTLGNAFNYRSGDSSALRGVSNQQRNLHPIADLPTPCDEKNQQFFTPSNGNIAIHL